MVEPHGVLGQSCPKRTARSRVVRRWALLSALAIAPLALAIETARGQQYESGAAQAATPATIDYASSRRLPPVEPLSTGPAASEPASSAPARSGPLLSVFGTPSPYDPFASQVNYLAPGTSAPAVIPPATNNRALLSGLVPQTKTQSTENEPADDGKSEDDQAGADGQKKDGEQTFGQAPTNNSLQFLRDVDVLLKPGAWQADTGFVYTHFNDDFPLPVFDPVTGEIIDVVEADLRNRLLFSPFAVRYGLTCNVQLFAALPVGYSNTQISTFGISQSEDTGGLGDLTAGASIHLLEGEDELPDVIATVGFTAPTGDFNAPIFGVVPGSALGQGFWATNVQLLFIHRYDPVIVFYGPGYRHLFEREFNGVLFAPGEQLTYMFGVGFSVNDRVTLSTALQGFYITDSYANGQDIPGTNLEPMSLRFAATIVRDCRIIEPFVQIGMTESAPAANFGIVFTCY